MYVTTFYSYKGGVGRTMALANVAVLLALRGKRVLVVDFDLEAPGLASYGALGCAQGHKGLLDYVETYRESLVAPDVSKYIVKCPLRDRQSVWLMPAGRSNTADYTDRLNRLDWDKLYRDEAGYLMFEDLKKQWANFQTKGFDYVLIDSRTGHTDVGGICTRHLPNSVVILFVPTAQNLDGLTPIVEGIRGERTSGQRDIRLHFCPSNVPDEFDEDGILQRLLDEASQRLKIGSDDEFGKAQIIHHRTSLQMLEQPLIALDRPKSKLVREFDQLRQEIISRNLPDRDGALEALKRIAERLDEDSRPTKVGLPLIVPRLAEIIRLHPTDGEVALQAAECMSSMGDYEQAALTFSIAIQAKFQSARAYLQRAVTYLVLGRKDQALSDLKAVLRSKEGSHLEFRPATQLLRLVDEDLQPDITELFQEPGLRTRAKIELATLMLRPEGDPELVADELLRELQRSDLQGDARSDTENATSLALIASGRFEEVGSLYDSADSGAALLFNKAIAQWGASGKKPIALLTRVLRLVSPATELDANTRQCLALAYSVAGDAPSALNELQKAESLVVPSSLIFSCWNYRYVSANEFTAHLGKMREAVLAGRPLRPPVLKRRKAAQP